MGNWYMQKIKIPDSLRLICKGDKSDSFDIYKPNTKFYILHYFNADCDKCINEVKQAKHLLDSIKGNLKDVKFVFIASGFIDLDNYVKRAIQETKFNYPIYYEDNYLNFKIVNKLSLDNQKSAYNTMLLDSQNRVLLFGAFYDNPDAFKIYTNLIDCMNSQ